MTVLSVKGPKGGLGVHPERGGLWTGRWEALSCGYTAPGPRPGFSSVRTPVPCVNRSGDIEDPHRFHPKCLLR